MPSSDRLIRFDWAIKKILRDKANFGILEGFLTVVLNEEVKIIEILESSSNQETEDDKFNVVDLLVKNSKEELIIIEVQNNLFIRRKNSDTDNLVWINNYSCACNKN